MSIFIENVLLPDRTRNNISIINGKIKSIGSLYDNQKEKIDGDNLLVMPSLFNSHTHSAMTLLRGFGEDLPLEIWLTQKIWPKEALYKEEDFYWGYRLAFLEMIKSGTGFFCDMYFYPEIAIKAAIELGIKGNINFVFIDGMNVEKGKELCNQCETFFKNLKELPEGLEIGLAPHSIYTVHPQTLSWISSFAKDFNLRVHIHLSETEKELTDSINNFGLRPAFHLDKLNFLSNKVLLAHGLWLDEDELKLISDKGSAIVHNPISNMKLSSGPALNLDSINKLNIPLLIGTDGVSSNNNLDIIEEMKIATLLQKQSSGNPTMGPANLIYEMATKNASEWFNTDSGCIEVGKGADLMLISTDKPHLTPMSDPIGSIVYSANGNDVVHMISSGNIIMKDRKVPNEDEIISKSSFLANKLLGI